MRHTNTINILKIKPQPSELSIGARFPGNFPSPWEAHGTLEHVHPCSGVGERERGPRIS